MHRHIHIWKTPDLQGLAGCKGFGVLGFDGSWSDTLAGNLQAETATANLQAATATSNLQDTTTTANLHSCSALPSETSSDIPLLSLKMIRQ